MKQKRFLVLFLSCLAFLSYSSEIYQLFALKESETIQLENTEKNFDALDFLPDNDNCLQTITLIVNTGITCENTASGTLEDATLTEGLAIGCGTSPAFKDVWYSFMATSTTHSIDLTADSTYDLHLELYADTVCSNHTAALACVAGTRLMQNDLTIGTTYFVRVYATWQYTNTAFTICVNTPEVPNNDTCENATPLVVNTNASCTLFTSSTLNYSLLTENVGTDCSGSAPQKDVWFSFTAVEENQVISISDAVQAYDVYLEVFPADICTNTDSMPIQCGQEILVLDNLVVGSEYKVRVYTTNINQNTDFKVCVRTISLPINDECSGALVVPVNTGEDCTNTLDATLADATMSTGYGSGCGFGAVKDVWFEFTATTAIHSINLSSTNSNFNGVQIELYNGGLCENLTLANMINCVSNTSITYFYFTPGQTYKFRVIASSLANNAPFTICIKSHFAPMNDECEQALNATVNTDGTCTLTTAGTFSFSTLAPLSNSGCDPYATPSKDVWFSFTATAASQHISLLNIQNLYGIYMQIYDTSSCPDHTIPTLDCSTLPKIVTELTPGTTYYIRLYSTNSSENSDFDLCIRNVVSPVNDTCDTALSVPVNQGIECVESIEGSFYDTSLTPNLGTCNEWFMPVKDIWYEFVATAISHKIRISGLENPYNVYAQVYEEGICNDSSLQPLLCGNPLFFDAGFEVSNLTIGATYKIRLYNTNLADTSSFSLCIVTFPPPIKVEQELYTVPDLISQVLINNPCAIVSDVTWSTGTNFGFSNGIGYFNQNGSNFPFKEGVVLVSGNAKYAEGPALIFNNPDFSTPNINDWPGDQQLTDYMNDYFNEPDSTYVNASSIEFDFTPIKSELKFNFIFASNDYSGGQQCFFSDVFAFFLTNTETGQTTNLAVVPGTNDPVSVLTIRKALHSPLDFEGNPICGDVNPEYFGVLHRDGFNGEDPALSPINFYGRTVPMVAESVVVPGVKYHLKLVVQDKFDSTMDSAVFLEAGSFDIGNVSLGEDHLIKTNNALCQDSSIVLDSHFEDASFSKKWFKNEVEIAGATTSTLTVNEPGTYRVEIGIPLSTCTITADVEIEFYPKLAIGPLENIEICSLVNESHTIDLTNNERLMPNFEQNPDAYGFTYHLSEAEAKANQNAISNPKQYLFSKLTETIYMRIGRKDINCAEVASFEVKKILKTPFTLTPVEVCVYDGDISTVNLRQVETKLTQQTNGKLQFYYFESIADAENTRDEIINNDMYQPTQLPMTVYVKIEEEQISCSSIIPVLLVETDRLVVDDLEPQTICTGYPLPPLAEGYFYSSEKFGQGERYEANYIIEESTTIFINTTNKIDCVFSGELKITILDCFIPKGISPNGDGLNDNLDLTNYKPHSVKIFNRHGRSVFEHGYGYTTQWYGQDKSGNSLPSGTYFYVIQTDTEELTGYIYINK